MITSFVSRALSLFLAALSLSSVGCTTWTQIPSEDRAVIINSTISAVINGAVKVATEDVYAKSVADLACEAEIEKFADYVRSYQGWLDLVPACQETRAKSFASATQVTTEAAITTPCVSVDPRPSLWPRVPPGFALTFRQEWVRSLTPLGLGSLDTGALRFNADTQCWEILTIGGPGVGYFWRPYDPRFDFIAASKFNRYGPGVGGGHSHGNDGLVCSPAEWLNEIEHRTGANRLTCESMEVLDTWFNRNRFYSLMTQYNALHPQTPANPPVIPVTPPVVPPSVPPRPVNPPIIPPAAPSCPEGLACRPEPRPCGICETCKTCETCKACEVCASPPLLVLVPSDILNTAAQMAEWIPIRGGKNAKVDRAKVAALRRLQDWLQAQHACEPVSLSPVVLGDSK